MSNEGRPDGSAGEDPGSGHQDSPPSGGGTWFDGDRPAHPADGPAVPERADSPWGSDHEDAKAEAAHRARYAWPAPADDPATGPGVERGGDAAAHSAPTQPLTQGSRSVPGDPGHEVPSAAVGSGEPAVPAPGAGSAPRRRGLWAGVVALCLLSGAVGGVAGQYVNDRVHLGGSTIPTPGPAVTARPAGSIPSLAAAVVPSVVTLTVRGDSGRATGSGFVIDDKGHVLTNNHVIDTAAESGRIDVLLSNGDTTSGTIVGRDVSYDLAVIKMERQDVEPLEFGASDGVVVGDQVIAVGAPLGLEQTVTSGIVSALNRPVSPGQGGEASFINAIQTDAAINPGNSGGPLLDLQGKVIGVNSAIARVPGTSGGSSGNIGLGFAIPSDQARRTADQLIQFGKANHPVIGVLLDRTYAGEGAQVVDQPNGVTPDGPAEKAGVQAGDVIVGFEGRPVRTPDQLIVSIRARAVGDTVTLTVERGGQEIELRMTLEASPDDAG